MRDRIDRGFTEKISMQPELELFLRYAVDRYRRLLLSRSSSVISVAIAQLLRDLEQCTETYFVSMTRTLWSSIETVTGQMPYVLELVRVVDAFVEGIKGSIEQKKYLRNFYDKASRCGYLLSLERLSPSRY
jgi:vacuolar protein sorting-associated protein 53